MAYDFPSSPANGQQYTPAGGQTYTWDAAGTKWTVTGTGLTSTTLGNRNLIINGDFSVDQRGNGSAQIATGPVNMWTLDRWHINMGQAPGAIVFWRSPIASTTGLLGEYHAVCQPTTADASLAASDNYRIQHRIEGHHFRGANWGSTLAKPITVSFDVQAGAGGPFTLPISFGNDGGTRCYTTTFTATSTNTRIVLVIPGDTTGTWLYDANPGLQITITLGAGTSYNNAALNTWGTGSFGAAGASNFMASTSNILYFKDFQVELGSQASPFERVPYVDQLARCQRYYQEYGGAPNAILGGGHSTQSTADYQSMTLVVEMNHAPTLLKIGSWTVFNCSQPSAIGASNRSFSITTVITAAGIWSYQPSGALDLITCFAEI